MTTTGNRPIPITKATLITEARDITFRVRTVEEAWRKVYEYTDARPGFNGSFRLVELIEGESATIKHTPHPLPELPLAAALARTSVVPEEEW